MLRLWNEFGYESKTMPVQTSSGETIFIKRKTPKRIPERPFFRRAIKKMQQPILKQLVAEVDPETMVVDRGTAGRIGCDCQVGNTGKHSYAP